jgi:hypothetical protein
MMKLTSVSPVTDIYDPFSSVMISSTTPGTTFYSWRVIVSAENPKNAVSSSTISTKVTVCGNEKLTVRKEEAASMALAAGFGELVVPADLLSNYFLLDSSAEGSCPTCKISKYEIQPATAGLKINPDDLSLVITEADLAAGLIDVTLVATTLGKVSAS